MKILFLTNLYPPNTVGGYERLCFEIAGGLSSYGWQVFVLTSDFGGKSQDFPRQTIERTLKLLADEKDIYQTVKYSHKQRAKINKNNIDILKRTVQQFQPDIVFVWNLYFFDATFLDAIKLIKQPIVYLITDNWLIAFLNSSFMQEYFVKNVLSDRTFIELLYLRTKRWFLYWKKPQFVLPGHAIFASRFMRDLYTEASFGFDSNTIIYHGVNLSENSPKDFSDRRKLLKHGEVSLLIAGRIVEIKGVHTVIESLPLIKHSLPNLKINLTVLGDDRDHSYLGRIRDQIARLKVADSVKFVESVTEDKLFNLFQKHDIFLFPSLYEPFSLTLIFALGAGIPTIASDAGGNSEIVKHLHTGILFPKGNERKLADAIVFLAKNNEMRVLLSDKARNVVRYYSFKRMMKEIRDLLESIR